MSPSLPRYGGTHRLGEQVTSWCCHWLPTAGRLRFRHLLRKHAGPVNGRSSGARPGTAEGRPPRAAVRSDGLPEGGTGGARHRHGEASFSAADETFRGGAGRRPTPAAIQAGHHGRPGRVLARYSTGSLLGLWSFPPPASFAGVVDAPARYFLGASATAGDGADAAALLPRTTAAVVPLALLDFCGVAFGVATARRSSQVDELGNAAPSMTVRHSAQAALKAEGSLGAASQVHRRSGLGSVLADRPHLFFTAAATTSSAYQAAAGWPSARLAPPVLFPGRAAESFWPASAVSRRGGVSSSIPPPKDWKPAQRLAVALSQWPAVQSAAARCFARASARLASTPRKMARATPRSCAACRRRAPRRRTGGLAAPRTG